MKINVSGLSELFRARLMRSAQQLRITEDSKGIAFYAKKAEQAYFEKGDNSVTFYYTKAYEFFYGVKLFLSDPNVNKAEIKCKFNEFGIMLDCSRNAVPHVEGVKGILDNLALLGYNQLQLYTEDTYEVEGEPYWGYQRGRYTMQEIKEIDAYAKAYDIELVPCIQTLAHVNQILRWQKYKKMCDIDDILTVGLDATYKLLDNIFKTIKKTFSSNKIHIGLDEAHNVGRGQYRDLFGKKDGDYVITKDNATVMCEHLNKVVEMAKEYGLEPMMWSDMFFRMANGGVYRVEKDAPPISEDVVKRVPKDVRIVYWDYYRDTQEPYEDMIVRHKVFNNEIVFAGGAWTWHGFAPYNKFSDVATENAFNACIKHGVKNVFLTMWGDDGAECPFSSLLSALCYASDYAYGQENHESSFLAFMGMSKEDFVTLDLVNDLKTKTPHCNTISKVAFYNDPFLGLFDFSVIEGESVFFKDVAVKLNKVKSVAGKYAYLFETMERFAKVLELKYDLGYKTRKAYKEGDKKALKNLIKDYKQTAIRVKKFYDAFAYQWAKQNKGFGFEVQDARIGGLILRLNHCADVLKQYVSGKIDRILELEQEILNPMDENGPKGRDVRMNRYMNIFSTGVISHNAL